MGWQINVLKNTVKVSETGAKAVFEKLEDSFEVQDVRDIVNEEGQLYFNSDHMEHMDYVPVILDVLLADNVNGEIAFGSLEGDNRGRAWGYRFADGAVTRLSGKLVPSWDLLTA